MPLKACQNRQLKVKEFGSADHILTKHMHDEFVALGQRYQMHNC